MNHHLCNLEGKVALVTGARRGLGQAVAMGLAASGADIATLDRTANADTREQVEAGARTAAPLDCLFRFGGIRLYARCNLAR